MADYLTTDTELTSVANAIRTKGGTSASLVYPAGFVSAIEAIPTGGNLQAKTNINPSTSSQTITPDTGYDGLSSVQINAMPSGSATTPATTITANPTISVSNSGLITATNSKTQSVTPTVSAGYVSGGTAGTITVNGSNTSQLSTQAAQTITPTTTNKTIASGKYLTGTQTIKGDANLVAGNIKSGVKIFGVTGTYEGSGGAVVKVSSFMYGESYGTQFNLSADDLNYFDFMILSKTNYSTLEFRGYYYNFSREEVELYMIPESIDKTNRVITFQCYDANHGGLIKMQVSINSDYSGAENWYTQAPSDAMYTFPEYGSVVSCIYAE